MMDDRFLELGTTQLSLLPYDAFISYRHAPMDIEISELIHKRLESIGQAQD